MIVTATQVASSNIGEGEKAGARVGLLVPPPITPARNRGPG